MRTQSDRMQSLVEELLLLSRIEASAEKVFENVVNVPTMMLAILTLGSLNLLAFGVVGNYAWRAYENSKQRPTAVVATREDNQGLSDDD